MTGLYSTAKECLSINLVADHKAFSPQARTAFEQEGNATDGRYKRILVRICP